MYYIIQKSGSYCCFEINDIAPKIDIFFVTLVTLYSAFENATIFFIYMHLPKTNASQTAF